MNSKKTPRPADPARPDRNELRAMAVQLRDSGHNPIQIAWNLRISPNTAHRLLAEADRPGPPAAPDGAERPGWFTGPKAALLLLARAAAEAAVNLDPLSPPGEEEAQRLVDVLADILVAEGFDAEWVTNASGDLIEGLHQYAYPD
ncbi:helix-turn-helix domain-containing protein [Kitasatospora sp. NPDC096147]|uniref:helix-turn-helix domain-containing protein n=1 Tax=Kitasatospora sp. NPDC096147 TaxID=3364093 RepID=UPI0038021129